MKRHVVIVAGGKGLRMGNDLPKQFLIFQGKPILMHTLESFYCFDSTMNCIVVLPESQIAYWEQLCEQYQFSLPHTVITGGKERFDSVKNGVLSIHDSGLVAIHDGVRPLVSPALLQRGFATAEEFGSAVPYVDSVDSLRIVEEEDSHVIDRTIVKRIQTPQIFNLTELQSIIDIPYRKEFTDEATLWEFSGRKIHFYQGENSNIKITTPEDLKIAEVLWES